MISDMCHEGYPSCCSIFQRLTNTCLPPMLHNLCQMPDSQNNHITIMLQNEIIVTWDMIPHSVVELCNVSEEPATSTFSFKRLHVLKISHFHAPFNLLTNFYINVSVSMLACLNLLKKKLNCIVLNYSVPVSYSTMNMCSFPLYSMLLQRIAETCMCCCQLLLTGSINVQPITTHVVNSFLCSKVCTYEYSASELLFHTIHNYVCAHEETIPKNSEVIVCLHICTQFSQ